MYIAYIELSNYRKLKAVHLDFTKATTVLVGANNSGKTSALLALRQFLNRPNRFSLNDFTVSNWTKIEAIGAAWIDNAQSSKQIMPSVDEWQDVLQCLDIWLNVTDSEVHLVKDLIPNLDWTSGLLGVRLRFEPKDCILLCQEYLKALEDAASILKAAAEAAYHDGMASGTEEKSGTGKEASSVALWPRSFCDFLDRRLPNHFVVRAYSLDPSKQVRPINGIASLQILPPETLPMDGNPLSELIRIDTIDAHRGFANSSDKTTASSDSQDGEHFDAAQSKQLSVQLRRYYATHLDPSESPEASDLEALRAIQQAQVIFNEKLRTCFLPALTEVETLGYPGFADPRLTISTKIKLTDGLNHNAAVQYELVSQQDVPTSAPMLLPEEYNGLGYQNLISMIFKLMSFRDGWMKVGKAAKRPVKPGEQPFLPPLHLVLIEEPEAHLHVQVQQVFIREAYRILRRHPDLGERSEYATQLVVSTHSSHLAHECQFSTLRYFRRSPCGELGSVPTATIVNLSDVFGDNDDTERFVIRYLKATHCDLFFADAAILVEGPAERILVPHFIRARFPTLSQRYITVLEIGGSHAHRLRPLIEALGLVTLVITDLDASASIGGKAVCPARTEGQVTRNATLKTWVPKTTSVDELLDLPSLQKVLQNDMLYAVRVAYQHPVKIALRDGQGEEEVLANTFEDALLYDNLSLFSKMPGNGLVSAFREILNAYTSPAELSERLFECLKRGDKAAFSLDVLLCQEPNDLNAPTYIRDGLAWLEDQVNRRQIDRPSFNLPLSA